MRDPYQFHPADIEEPPRTPGSIFRRIGPGMILAASIVGSGELIATTTLGAEVGYVCLWIIIFSCIIKPAMQAEIGRFSIVTGETGLAGFNQVPGPRWRVNWVVWMWAAMVFMSLFQVGAMYGGVAQVLNQLMPAIPVNAWVLAELALTLALLLGGGYERIEGLATIKVGLFTLITVMAAALLTRRGDLFSWSDVANGFTLQLPKDGLMTAIAVFGITGVGASELFMYPYWCVEKGYARFAGPQDQPGWQTRVKGWIRVMQYDVLASMFIYSLATVAFYLLGAGILHPQGLVPSAKDMIPVLSRMYTETLGGWALWVFYAGAIATLYGTIFASTAAHSRVFADLVRLLGGFERTDYAARLKWRKRFTVALASVPVVLFLAAQSPVMMVKAGGVAQAVMLPVIAVGVLFLRHWRLPREARPGSILTAGLWLAALLTVSVMVISGVLSLSK